jgi:hypothetical protein
MPATFYVSAILLFESDVYQPFYLVCQSFNLTLSF